MKNLFLLILMSTLLGCGTDQGEGKIYTYSVKNQTDKRIEIFAYDKNNLDSEPNITIMNPDDEITKTFQDGLPPQGYTYGVFFGGDSLVVLYSNERYNTFVFTSCAGSDRNPLNTCEYHSLEEYFIFSSQDYQNAIPCDGNCE